MFARILAGSLLLHSAAATDFAADDASDYYDYDDLPPQVCPSDGPWKLQTSLKYESPHGDVNNIDWLNDETVMVGRHYSIDVWDVPAATLVDSLKNKNQIVTGLAAIDEAHVAVSQNTAKGLKVWDAATQTLLATLESQYPLCVAAVDPEHVVVGLRSAGHAEVWNWKTKTLVSTLLHGAEGTTSVTAVDALADGTILTGGNDGGVRFYTDWREKETSEGEASAWFGYIAGQIQYIDALDDKTFTAGAWTEQCTPKPCSAGHRRNGSANKKLRIWKLNGSRIRSLVGHTGPIRDAAFLNEEMVVSVSEDSQAQVWNWKDGEFGECIQTFDLPSGWANAVAVRNSSFAVVSQPYEGKDPPHTGVTTISVFGLAGSGM